MKLQTFYWKLYFRCSNKTEDEILKYVFKNPDTQTEGSLTLQKCLKVFKFIKYAKSARNGGLK